MSSKHLPRSYSLAQKLLVRSVPDVSGCLLWQGAMTPMGYGTLSKDSKQYYTHHAAWISTHGPIPAGRWVLHKCDVRRCVNVDHLYLGDVRDNTNDMMTRGRSRPPTGENHGLSKLTADKVRAIRADRRSHRAIAADYGVSHRAIGDVQRGVTWGHVQQESSR